MKLSFLSALIFTTIFQNIYMMEKSAVSLEELKKDPTSYYSWLPPDLHNELKKIFKHPAFEWIMYEHARINGFFPHFIATPSYFSLTADREHNRLIAGTYSNTIEILNLDTGELQESLTGLPPTFPRIVFNATSNRVVATVPGAIQEWDLNTKQGKIIIHHNEYLSCIAIDKLYTRLFLGGLDGIKSYDLKSFELQKQLNSLSEINALTLKKNQLIAGLENGIINIYHPETLNHQKRLECGINQPIRTLALNKNDKLFASTSDILYIWNLNTDQKLYCFHILTRRGLTSPGYIAHIETKTKKIYCIDYRHNRLVVYNLEDPQMKKILDTADADTTLLISSIYEAIKNKTKVDLSDKSRKKVLKLLPILKTVIEKNNI